MKINGWGNYPIINSNFISLSSFQKEQETYRHNHSRTIPQGMGRSYGDSSLSDTTVSTLHHNYILEFDKEEGMVSVESGVILSDLLEIIVPHGWFAPVTPGTRLVTIGGMIASDVHGKNHHCDGSFGHHITSMTLLMSDGSKQTCTPEENTDLFYATIGGMGLTGIILEATFKLRAIKSAYIRQESIRVKNIHEAMEVFEKSEDWTYSVAWIDCIAKRESLGRSIIMRGEHAKPNELNTVQSNHPLELASKKRLSVPFNFPSFALNHLSIKIFNTLYYNKTPKGTTEDIIDYNTFFYPLDSILHWNRIYGKTGFVQYQFVLPRETSKQAMPEILKLISDAGSGSFLAVLKLFGKEDKGFLSFPREGYTLALDFPATSSTFTLLNKLDEVVHKAEGRIYLSKDARMQSRWMDSGYENLKQFQKTKRDYDKNNLFRSLQSDRLQITSDQ